MTSAVQVNYQCIASRLYVVEYMTCTMQVCYEFITSKLYVAYEYGTSTMHVNYG